MRGLLIFALLALTTCLDARPPNLVIFLSDDQGWGDLSSSGNTDLRTPRIDSLAAQGASFRHFYVSPVCSPTRAEFLTGRYHPRGGVSGTSAGDERLDLDETTLAEIFKKAGYATGAFGKWHNGTQSPYHPNDRGFDEFYGFCSGHWGHYFSPMLDHNGRIVEGNGFTVDDFTDRAISFIETHRGRPFVCYLPYNTPHSPMQVPEEYWLRFKDKKLEMPHAGDEAHLRCALAMCENLDANVGRVLDALDRLDLSGDTIVLYFSDNGPNGQRWNGGMKGIKGSVDEGGIRSPLLVRWPGKIPAGSTVGTLAAAIDLLPTLTGLAGIPCPTAKPLDGLNLAASLLGTPDPAAENRSIFSSWGNRVSVRTPGFRLDSAGALFDMIADPGQRQNVAAAHPAIAAELGAAARAHAREMSRELDQAPRPFIIAHPASPFTQLPARDAVFSGGIQRSSRHPNDSYLTHWHSPGDRITWDVEVAAAGEYQVEIFYTCSPEDIGSGLELSFNESRLTATLDQARAPSLIGAAHDRAPRDESYVQPWQRASIGKIRLNAGPGKLTLQAPKIPGGNVMDFRMLFLTRVPS